MPETKESGLPRHRLIGLLLGPAVVAIMLASPAPERLSPRGWATASVGILMAVWWMTEAVPLAVISAVAVGAVFRCWVSARSRTVRRPHAHPLVFLFLGGFLLARAMHVWKLDRRLALTVLHFAGVQIRAA